MISSSQPLQVGEFLRYLAPTIVQSSDSPCPLWPADVFAITAALLEKGSVYNRLGTKFNPANCRLRWLNTVDRIADEWRQKWKSKVPNVVSKQWSFVMRHLELEVGSIRQNKKLCESLSDLLAISDAAMLGVGLVTFNSSLESAFWRETESLLEPWRIPGFGNTLCRDIHPTRLRVLPKSRTPESGLSLRSLTHHLALCPPLDVIATWWSYGFGEVAEEEYCNLLLIPWPFEIEPSQFSAVSTVPPDERDSDDDEIDANLGDWFAYSPRNTSVGELLSLVELYIKSAESRVGESCIHLVIFPELALTTLQYTAVRDYLTERGIGIVAGIATDKPMSADSEWPQNTVNIALPKTTLDQPYVEIVQAKHHRWRLDADQIVRYGLASRLDPSRVWWEGIRIDDRAINFLRLRSWLSTCVLICEDLARVDPVGRFVRAVAPDLVIALLLDGPQFRSRWPAYHATVLADDPGCSVLTLTSLGMTKLSTMKETMGKPHTAIIGLWRDPVHGIVEIELPAGATAAVLTLTSHRTLKAEITADNRLNELDLGSPVYGGINFI